MSNENENETVCVPLSKLVVTEKKPYEDELQRPPFASDWPFLPSEIPGVDVSNASTDITPEMDIKALAMAALRIQRDAKRYAAINTNKGSITWRTSVTPISTRAAFPRTNVSPRQSSRPGGSASVSSKKLSKPAAKAECNVQEP